jgi:phosphoribosylanthranilate isomerase
LKKKMIIQIYEIQTPGEAETMAALGVDHIGSVIVSGDAWQQPRIRETIRAAKAARARSTLIPLFNDRDLVLRSMDYYQPDIVHFCDMLAPGENLFTLEKACAPHIALQAGVKNRFPEIAIMRSIPIPAASNDAASMDVIHDAERITAGIRMLVKLFGPVSDYFLTDTLLTDSSGAADQPVDGFVGITGKTCDWKIAAELVRISPLPVILAGGISPENVSAGIECVRPAGVDSCTLTNAVDAFGGPVRFKKDVEKVRRFVAKARRG